MPVRPPPLKLKYDNFKAPLPAPSAPKPKAKESFFQKLYKASWRNVVIGVAGLNAIRFAFASFNAFEDARVDNMEHKPRLVTVSIALCVMYALSCAIEIYGVVGIALQRMSLVRAYVFLELASALLVTVSGVLTAASFFLNAEDLMYECVSLALTGKTFAKSQFRSRPWPSMYPLGLRAAQKQCVAAWTHESWTQVMSAFLFGFVPALLGFLLVYSYYRQTIDAAHPAYLVPRQRLASQLSRQMEQVRNDGYARVPNADDPYAGTPSGETNGRNQRSARLRAGRKSAARLATSLNAGPTATMSRTAAGTSRSLKRAHRPPALVELEGPVFALQKSVMMPGGTPLSVTFSPGPPSFGVNIFGPSRLGIGAYGPAVNLNCSGGPLSSSRYAKFV